MVLWFLAHPFALILLNDRNNLNQAINLNVKHENIREYYEFEASCEKVTSKTVQRLPKFIHQRDWNLGSDFKIESITCSRV